MRSLAKSGALIVLALACGKRVGGGGVEVDIRPMGFTPACLEVIADDGLGHRGDVAVPVTRPGAHSVGVALLPDWGHALHLTVSAREGSCQGPRLASPEELDVDVPVGKVTHVTVELHATDADGDGWAARPEGSDCDDADAMRAPGVAESCADGVDNDCDGLADCAEQACLNQTCATDSDPCATDDRCRSVGDAGCRGVPMVCPVSTNECHVRDGGVCTGASGCTWPARVFQSCGAPGGGMACNGSAMCVPGDRELDCADGADDPSDTDTLADCADPDCAGVACNGGPCLLGATCDGGACTGTAKTCGPPGVCEDAGSCNPADGGCSYPAAPLNSRCDDGNACTVNDTCDGMRKCRPGSPMSCTTMNPCATSSCDAGACVLAARAGSCDDGNLCTVNDVCSGLSCMSGSMNNCGAPPECRTGNGCLADGGCIFAAVGDGTSCDGGTCAGGSCVGGFPYTVSNVAVVPPSAGTVTINCTVTFDSTDGGVSPANWCGAGAPAVSFVQQTVVTEQAVVLSVTSLSVTPAGRLNLVGTRPVVLQVHDRGTTVIDGRIEARGRAGVPGAGGDRIACGLQAGRVGTPNGQRGSGAGGGGYVTAGGAGGSAYTFPPPTTISGGLGGTAGTVSATPLVGGCPGGRGGDDGMTGGRSGAGGGALQISVAGELRLDANARISVSGGGAPRVATDTYAGGGGGGSGGTLLLEATRLNLNNSNAWLTSNGGAGAEGADNNQPGQDGADGANDSSSPSPGGDSDADEGGNGGDGAAGGSGPQSGVGANSGGGGGGSVGVIFLRSIDVCTRSASASPSATNAFGCP